MTLCRLSLAATFVVSGFVKAVDPMGMFTKVNAYFEAWGHPFSDDSIVLTIGVGALAVFEFMLGIYLLLGIRRRFTTVATTAFMVAMTIVTLYIFFFNPVADCGCFGEAFTLTNGETLAKNVVLLAAAVVVVLRRRYLLRLISERNQWITSLYAAVYVILLTIGSIRYLPLMDFSAFRTGTDLRTAYYEPSAETPATLLSFYAQTSDGDDMTDSLLQARGYTFLLTLSNPATADDGCNDRINDIYDACRDARVPFFALVPNEADSAQIAAWIDCTGAAYEFLNTDNSVLSSMVRSNPGLLLLHDGRVVGKWGNNNLPDFADGLDMVYLQSLPDGRRPLTRLILWFIIPLVVIIFIDRLWIGSKYYKRYTIKKHLKHINMRQKIVAGNWKMNKTLQDGVALATELNTTLTADKPNCGVIICTPFIHLATVAGIIDSSIIGLGAENCADKASGAYTGEVSAEMVKSTGAQYVILGHSERRAYYHETPEILKEKVNLALANGLKVIFCIGEVLEEREAGKQNEVVKAQLEGSLFDLSKEEFSNIILAYEPVWAIGTGKTATADQAEEMHAFIRATIAEKFGAEAAENVSILYGGSCKPSNAKELFAKPDVDGGLIGGAALKAADFKGIIDAWK